jgi:hypothetical protein
MNTAELLATIDEEITRLQQARSLLAGGGENIPSLNKTRKSKRKSLSAEARAKISAAQKKRWAAQKKAAK